MGLASWCHLQVSSCGNSCVCALHCGKACVLGSQCGLGLGVKLVMGCYQLACVRLVRYFVQTLGRTHCWAADSASPCYLAFNRHTLCCNFSIRLCFPLWAHALCVLSLLAAGLCEAHLFPLSVDRPVMLVRLCSRVRCCSLRAACSRLQFSMLSQLAKNTLTCASVCVEVYMHRLRSCCLQPVAARRTARPRVRGDIIQWHAPVACISLKGGG